MLMRYFSVRLALATEIAILLDDRAMEIPECWDDVPCFPVEHGEVPLLCLDGAMGEVPWMTPLFWGTGRNIFRFRNIFICPNSNRLSVSLLKWPPLYPLQRKSNTWHRCSGHDACSGALWRCTLSMLKLVVKKAPKLPKRIGNMMSDQWILGIRHQKPTNIYTWMDWYANFWNPAACSCGILGFSWASSCWISGVIAAFRSPPRCKRIWFFIQGKNPMGQSAPLWFPDVAGLNITCGGKIEVFRPKSYVYQVMKRKAGKNTIGQPGVRMLLNFGGF